MRHINSVTLEKHLLLPGCSGNSAIFNMLWLRTITFSALRILASHLLSAASKAVYLRVGCMILHLLIQSLSQTFMKI